MLRAHPLAEGRCFLVAPTPCTPRCLAQLIGVNPTTSHWSWWDALIFFFQTIIAELIRREDRTMTTFSKIIGGSTLAIAAALLTLPAFTAASAPVVADCCCGKDCKCPECGCASGVCTNCQCEACNCEGCACGEDCGSPCCPASQQAIKADGCCKEKAGKAGSCCKKSDGNKEPSGK